MGLLRQCLQEVRERECPQPPIFTPPCTVAHHNPVQWHHLEGAQRASVRELHRHAFHHRILGAQSVEG